MLLLERFDRAASTHAALSAAFEIEDPNGLLDTQARLDALLDFEPAHIEPEMAELMDALGVSRG